MSVIVKGMEMPNTCEECQESCEIGSNLFCLVVNDENKWGWKKSENGFESRPVWCPLRPMPKKHGRLIEADSLKETLDYYIREAGWDAKTNRVLGWVKDEFIDSESTIVEAEGDD